MKEQTNTAAKEAKEKRLTVTFDPRDYAELETLADLERESKAVIVRSLIRKRIETLKELRRWPVADGKDMQRKSDPSTAIQRVLGNL